MWDIAHLFRRHQKDLQRFLQRRGIPHDAAADISQDTFLRLMTTPRAASDVVNTDSYVYRVASNLSIDFRRSQQRQRIVGDSEAALLALADQQPSQERLFMSRQELAVVRAALEEVPARPRSVFLARIDGQTFAEISRNQGVPIKTAFSQVMKVTLFLKSRLDQATTISS